MLSPRHQPKAWPEGARPVLAAPEVGGTVSRSRARSAPAPLRAPRCWWWPWWVCPGLPATGLSPPRTAATPITRFHFHSGAAQRRSPNRRCPHGLHSSSPIIRRRGGSVCPSGRRQEVRCRLPANTEEKDCRQSGDPSRETKPGPSGPRTRRGKKLFDSPENDE